MNEAKLRELVKRLDARIHSDEVDSSISPTLGSGCVKTQPFPLYISKDMAVEQLTQNELLLAHVLIHKFYAQRTNRDFTKKELKELHERVIRLLPNHTIFDRLDKSGTN